MNIFLIAIDTLRPDHLECYGYHYPTSPTLARFAQESVVFDACFAGTIPTAPSFTSLFTGLDAYAHEIVGVGDAGEHEIRRRHPTLPQILGKNGYYTCAVDSLNTPNQLLNFDRHFDSYIRNVPFPSRPKKRIAKRHAERVCRDALALLQKRPKEKDLFMFLHFWDPHTPYWPPAEFARIFYQGNEKDASNASMKKLYVFPGFDYKNLFDAEVTDINFIIAQYDAMIRYNSEHLGRFFTALKREGLWENALVIVLSDHGEVLDKHEGYFDHHGLYDDNIRTVLMLKYPQGRHAGKRVQAFSQILDVPATVFAATGIRTPRHMHGHDLTDLVLNHKKEFYREIFLGEATWQCKRGIRDKKWKFIRALSDKFCHNWHGGALRELYDLENDPEEQTNLIKFETEVARKLAGKLDHWLDKMKKHHGYDDPILRHGPTMNRVRKEMA